MLNGQCIPYGETNVWWPIAAMVAEACEVDLTDADGEGPALHPRRGARRARHRRRRPGDRSHHRGPALPDARRRSGRGRRPDPGPRGGAARRAHLLRRARERRNRSSSSSRTSTGATTPSSTSSPACSRTSRRTRSCVVGTTRPELTDRWSPPAGPPQHRARQPRPARRRRHRRAAAQRCFPTPTPSSCRSCATAAAATRSSSRSSSRCSAKHRRAEGARELPGHAARAARGPPRPARPARPRDARGRGGHRQHRSARARARARHGPWHRRRSPARPPRATTDLLELDDDEYRFRNELTRDVAYGTLTKAERARRHGSLAKLIAEDAEANDRIDEVLDRLAYHFNLAASLMAELGAIDGLPSGMVPRRRALPHAGGRAGRAARRLGDGRQVPEPRDPARRPRTTRRPAPAAPRPRPGPRRAARQSPARATTSSRCSPPPRCSTTRARMAAAQTVLGDVQYKEGDLVGSAKTLDDAVARWRELDDPRGLGDALRFRGLTELFGATRTAPRCSSMRRSEPLPVDRAPPRRGVGAAEPRVDLVRPGSLRGGRATPRRVRDRVRRARRLGRHELGARPARLGPLHPGPARGSRGARGADPAGGDRARATAGPRRSCACCSPTSRCGAASRRTPSSYAAEARVRVPGARRPVGRAAVDRAGDARAQRAAAHHRGPARWSTRPDVVAARVPDLVHEPAPDGAARRTGDPGRRSRSATRSPGA